MQGFPEPINRGHFLDLSFALAFFAIFLGTGVQATLGFGFGLFSVPLLMMVFPSAMVMPIVICLSFFNSGSVAFMVIILSNNYYMMSIMIGSKVYNYSEAKEQKQVVVELAKTGQLGKRGRKRLKRRNKTPRQNKKNGSDIEDEVMPEPLGDMSMSFAVDGPGRGGMLDETVIIEGEKTINLEFDEDRLSGEEDSETEGEI